MQPKPTTEPFRLGFFYVLQPFPEFSPNRIKFGWSSNLPDRLMSHRCVAPTARLVDAWPCPSIYEHVLVEMVVRHQRNFKRVGRETYDIGDLVKMHQRIERSLIELGGAGIIHRSVQNLYLQSQRQVPKERCRPNRRFDDPTADAAIEAIDSPSAEADHTTRRPSRRHAKQQRDEYWANPRLTPLEEAILHSYAT